MLHERFQPLYKSGGRGTRKNDLNHSECPAAMMVPCPPLGATGLSKHHAAKRWMRASAFSRTGFCPWFPDTCPAHPAFVKWLKAPPTPLL